MNLLSYKIITPPAALPVSLAEAKNHLKIDHNDEDTYVESLIEAATKWAEEYTWRFLIDTEAQLFINNFENKIYVGKGCNDISEIAYLDNNDAYQVIPSTNYYLDLNCQPAIIQFKDSYSFPVTSEKLNLIRISLTAGFGPAASDVPSPIKSAILLMVGHLYENRQDEISGTVVSKFSINSKFLLNPYRINTF